MARARNIKPGVMENERLAECSPYARILFIYLWMIADRAGRLEDRPRRIKAQTLPYDNVDADPLLDELHAAEFIKRYVVDGAAYIQIINFERHQSPHVKEKPSTIPEYCASRSSSAIEPCEPETKHEEAPDKHRTSTGQAPDKTDKAPELAPPDSLIVDCCFIESPISEQNPVAETAPDIVDLDQNEAMPPGYAFEGERIRINWKDYQKQAALYPFLDLLSEYNQLDIELRNVTQKRIWGELNAKLNYRNRIAAGNNKGSRDSVANESFIDDELVAKVRRISEMRGRN